jgi:3-hydroxyacyl-CoA dehydrogenase
MVLRMVAEAGYVLQENLVARESDVDTATALGIGFPDFRGGVLNYARDPGADRVRHELEGLAADGGERLRPCVEPLST